MNRVNWKDTERMSEMEEPFEDNIPMWRTLLSAHGMNMNMNMG